MQAAQGDAHPATKRVPKPEPVLDTIEQTVEQHPALVSKGKDRTDKKTGKVIKASKTAKLRAMIHRAQAGDADLALLKLALVRIGRSVFISRPHFNEFLEMHRALPPAPPRGRGRPAA